MLILLSPSKRLDTQTYPKLRTVTQPEYLADAQTLINRLRKISRPKLAKMMSISDDLADLNYQRFQNWQLADHSTTATPAMYMFRGDVYDGLQADSFSAADRTFAQHHLRILSGLYGILNPLDRVLPYRLEMGSEFASGKPKTLYEFWGETLRDNVRKALSKQQHQVIINLASQEYAKAVKLKQMNCRVITPSFKEDNGTKRQMISFFAKKARGTMARFLIKNRFQTPTDALSFNLDGYTLDEESSQDDAPVFVRPKPQTLSPKSGAWR